MYITYRSEDIEVAQELDASVAWENGTVSSYRCISFLCYFYAFKKIPGQEL